MNTSMKSVMSRAVLGVGAIGAMVGLAMGGQPTSRSPLAPPANGVRQVDVAGGHWALTNATVHATPTDTFEHSTVVVKDGRIWEVVVGDKGTRLGEPSYPGAQVRDCTGLHIYAGFIEPFVEVDSPRPETGAPGTHWNPRVTPERGALDKGSKGIDRATAESLRGMGFTAAAISPRGGVFRGRGAVVSLASEASNASAETARAYRDGAYLTVGFDGSNPGSGSAAPATTPPTTPGVGGFGRGGGGGGDAELWPRYPDSHMGVIALIRQTLSDADWQRRGRHAAGGASAERSEWARQQGFDGPENCLDALAKVEGAPGILFDVADELEALRAAKIMKEFGREGTILGSGMEFRRLEAIKRDGFPLVVPLAFPEKPRVDSLGRADEVELTTLMNWEQAPTNARRLDEAGVRVSLTTGKISDRRGGARAFPRNLESAIKHGLKPERALAMLTTNPAEMLGVDRMMGTIESGKVANLVVADGALFVQPAKPSGDAAAKAGAEESKPATDTVAEGGESPKTEGAAEAAEDKPKDKKAKIVEVWIDGRQHIIDRAPEWKIEGEWAVTFDPPPPPPVEMQISLSIEEGNAITITKVSKDADGKDQTATAKAQGVRLDGNRLSFRFEHEPFGEPGVYLNNAVVERGEDGTLMMYGDFQRTGGARMKWIAKRVGDVKKREPGGRDQGIGGSRDRGGRRRERGGEGARDQVGGPGAGRGEAGAGVAEAKPVEEAAGEAGKGAEKKAVVEGGAPPADRGEATRPEREGPSGVWVLRAPDGAQYPTDVRAPKVEFKKDGTIVVRPGIGEGGQEQIAREVRRVENKIYYTVDVPGEQGQGGGPITVTLTIDAAKAERLSASASVDGPENFILVPYKRDAEAEDIASIPEKLGLPLGPYAWESMPEQERVVVTNATIWTNAAKGIIKNGTLVVEGGRIRAVLDGSAPAGVGGEGWRTIDAAGRHVTAGIIDCHSHTGISKGVNESGQAVTAEVRIQDVTNPDAVNWYRQLAGGVTAVNNLHGSANPIGGQNCVNKLRWGASHPDDMHFEGAIPGIKFALGENVKQSNSGGGGGGGGGRYPTTRMGVETLIRDRFTAAREYLQNRPLPPKASEISVIDYDPDRIPIWQDGVKKIIGYRAAARRDLELEALAEILNGDRLVHCHSYRQDEILMLCRVAQEFGFKVGTFQHILEGYKVADDIAKTAIGASAFSDWWAYKVEVQDAIPYAGPIMHEQGVCVSYNSDSDELARRMNVEAGKAVKYSKGKVTPEEALKFVTLNPAKQLKVETRVGSLEVGKDADFVIWSGDPLSSLTRCEATFVDGRCMFSLEKDAQLRKRDDAERQRLVQKALASDTGGGSAAGGFGGGGRGGRGRGGGGAETPGTATPPTLEFGEEEFGGLTAEDLIEIQASGRRLMVAESTLRAADYRREYYLAQIRRGWDWKSMRSGDCGCEAP